MHLAAMVGSDHVALLLMYSETHTMTADLSRHEKDRSAALTSDGLQYYIWILARIHQLPIYSSICIFKGSPSCTFSKARY